MSVQTSSTECIAALDAHKLQVLGHRGWYDVRRNGATKRWKRSSHHVEIPVKCGLRECFRLEFHDDQGGCLMSLRIRPNNFDPRNRSN
jgi:hypothetical protein